MYAIKNINNGSLVCVHRSDSRYLNYPDEAIWSQFIETLRLLGVGTFAPATRLGDQLIPTLCAQAQVVTRNHDATPLITWLGHAQSLIQMNGLNILMDPNFAQKTPPVFYRYTPAGIELGKLPPIDVILISHNHADHAHPSDLVLLAQAYPNAYVVAGSGSKNWLLSYGFRASQIIEGTWWDQIDLNGIKITITPAQHGSQTSLSDANTMLWCGFVIQAEQHTVYYSGDTSLGAHLCNAARQRPGLFQEVKKLFPHIEFALLPIAPDGEELMHMNHHDAYDAVRILNPQQMVPVHHGTLRTGKECVEEPITCFMRVAKHDRRVLPLKIGAGFFSGKTPQAQQCIPPTLWGATKTVIFDFDGTMVLNFSAILTCINDYFAKHGIPSVNSIDVIDQLGFVQTFWHMRALLGLQQHVLKFLDRTIEEYRVPDGLLQWLRENKSNLRIGIITRNQQSTVLKFLRHHGVQDCVQFIREASHQLGKRSVMQAVMDHYFLEPQNTFYVGDEKSDIDAATGLMNTIGVTWGGHTPLQLRGADRIVTSIEELAHCITHSDRDRRYEGDVDHPFTFTQ